MRQRARRERKERRTRSEIAASYWVSARGPGVSLLFILPMLVVYEGAGFLWPELGPAARTGVDLWLRSLLEPLGLGAAGQWLAPGSIVASLLVWQVACWRRGPRVHLGTIPAMWVESVVLAIALVGLSRLLDRALAEAEPGMALLLSTGSGPKLAGRPLAPLVSFLGAGLYEEALFRLALVPILYWGFRLLQAPDLAAGTLAVTGASLAFALAHHAGQLVEPFTWYVFLFRWIAGVYFAGLFLLRGFGIAVGTHAAYDVLVGWLDWPTL